MIDPARLDAAYQAALAALMQERHPDGYWVGELSTSALSTATAVMALHLVQKHSEHAAQASAHSPLIDGGLHWLAQHQNEDGGWGDTTKSLSNISTTMLCRAAFHLTGAVSRFAPAVSRAENWLFSRYGSTPEQLAEAVRARYGKDRTFAVPILTTCALAGLVDWREVPPLPFELAIFPQSWFRFLRLHVVSYALPALIAIGQCIFYHKKPWNPLTLLFRALSRKRTLRVLESIQPSSGGFLEATPLTSFVTLSLAASGLADHRVAVEGTRFLVNSVRPDGSWPIDTNLSTWVTTLAINALAAAGEIETLDKKDELRAWLLNQQYRERHPYTGTAPGGWAWTPLPGGVPDADDTPGALLALVHLYEQTRRAGGVSPLLQFDHRGRPHTHTHTRQQGADAPRSPVEDALSAGADWLLNLHNRDGGWPTFCRGWGHLPFDRSGNDLAAHVLRSIVAVASPANQAEATISRPEFRETINQGLAYLARTQRPDGSWLPLWFGNQHAHDDENPVYGTARVLAAYRDLNLMDDEPARRGVAWLVSVQNADGGWGGAKDTPSSMEETALAVEVLLDAGDPARSAVDRGVHWLVERVEQGGLHEPSPIGFYFAKLWYYEKLYPIIFAVAALGKARQKRAAGERGSRSPVARG